MREVDVINAASGGSYLMLEALQSLSNMSGLVIDAAKIILVLVVVSTSSMSALAADKDGDGIPDVIANARRFCRALRGKRGTPRSRRSPERDQERDQDNGGAP